MKTKTSLTLAFVALLLALLVIYILGLRPLPEARRPSPVKSLISNQPLPVEQTAANLSVLLPTNKQASVQSDASAHPAAGQPLVRSNPLDAPGWAVPYGKEFWRQPAAPVTVDSKGSGTTNVPASLNIGDVIERVRHALTQSSTAAEPQVAARTYSASFDGKGLVFSPHLPPDANIDSLDIGAENDVSAPLPDPKTQFTLRTVGVRQGNTPLYAADKVAAGWNYVGNTAQALLSEQAGLVEHYELRSDGAHLTWVLGRKPLGVGNVTIEVAAGGLSYRGETENGQHFTDASGKARVCVGQVTAVDAAGKSWSLSIAANGTQASNSQHTTLNIFVPHTVLAEATYPLAIDPVVSPEYGMDNPVYGVPTPGQKYSPSVAWNGASWLVVWQADYSILGARVNGSGVVLDGSGIPICTSLHSGYQKPAVACGGSDWLVVWTDDRRGSYDIYGARVNANGGVYESSGIPISTATNSQHFAEVAWNGTNWLVIWEDYRNNGGSSTTNTDIYGARVTGGGVVLETNGIAICAVANYQYSPAVASDGTNWFVVWEDYRNGSSYDIYGTRVNGSGVVQESGGIPICTAPNSQVDPGVAWGVTNWLVVWGDDRKYGYGNYDIYGTRLTGAGNVLDSSGLLINAVSRACNPWVAWGKTNWLVVWQDGRNRRYYPISGQVTNYDIYGTWVSGGGSVSETNGIAICTAPRDQLTPAVAWGGTNWLAVWCETDYWYGESDYGICGTLVSASGVASGTNETVISTAPNYQQYPAVASGVTNWLLVWQDYRSYAGWDIWGVRVNDGGVVLDSSGIPICTVANNQLHPAVAWGGTNWLVVWSDYRNYTNRPDIYGARVTESGVVLETLGIPISTATSSQHFAEVAWNGTNWLVVWVDLRNNRGMGIFDIYGGRVNEGGIVQDSAGIAICTTTNYSTSPAVAANGSYWLVVWAGYRGASGYDIYGARLDGQGKVMESGGIAICTHGYDQGRPSLAANGTDWLVVWDDYSNIWGTRVNASGVVLNPGGISICTATKGQRYSAVTSSGTNWMVVWQDYRNGITSDIYGAQVSGSGAVMDPLGFAVNTNSQDQLNPAIAELNKQHLVVYESYGVIGSPRSRGNVLWIRLAIASQPQSRTNVVGTTARFAVTATGSGPMRYQWLKDGTNIAGANNDFLTLTNVQLASAGSYSVIISNSFDSITSLNATLTVRPVPVERLDPTFNPGAGGPVYSLAVQPDGKILVGGNFMTLAGQWRTNIARLNADGTVDATFNPGANNPVYSLAVGGDGKILVGGEFTMLRGDARNFIGRLNADGTLDSSFTLGANNTIRPVAVQADGKVVVGGNFTMLGILTRNCLGRFNADGTLDTSFNPGASGSSAYVNSMAVQADGKILVGGNFTGIAGQWRTNIARLNAEGSADTTFNPGADGEVCVLLMQADGKILVGGNFTALNGQPRSRIARLYVDGTLDTNFNPAANGKVYSMALQTDGRIVVGGDFSTLGGQPRTNLARLNADGTLDTSFNLGADSQVTSVGVQANGKILVGGNFTTAGGQMRNYIGRLTSEDEALESVNVDSSGWMITWNRRGTGPEIEQATFEQSLTGTNYTSLGSGTRIAGGWMLGGLSLPINQNFYIRARGRVVSGMNNGSGGLIESVQATYIPPPPPALSDGLVGYWDLDEQEGLVAHDRSGRGNDGTLANYPRDNYLWEQGMIGGALQFRGPLYRNYICVANFPKSTNEMTLAAWVEAEGSSQSGASIMNNWGEATPGQFKFGLVGTPGRLACSIQTTAGTLLLQETQPFQQGVWQHVACVVDGTMIRLYRNGEQVAEQPCFGHIIVPGFSQQALGIGVKLNESGTGPDPANPGYWKGRLDEVAIWSRALALDEIQLLYADGQAGRGLTDPSPSATPSQTITINDLLDRGFDCISLPCITITDIPTLSQVTLSDFTFDPNYGCKAVSGHLKICGFPFVITQAYLEEGPVFHITGYLDLAGIFPKLRVPFSLTIDKSGIPTASPNRISLPNLGLDLAELFVGPIPIRDLSLTFDPANKRFGGSFTASVGIAFNNNCTPPDPVRLGGELVLKDGLLDAITIEGVNLRWGPLGQTDCYIDTIAVGGGDFHSQKDFYFLIYAEVNFRCSFLTCYPATFKATGKFHSTGAIELTGNASVFCVPVSGNYFKYTPPFNASAGGWINYFDCFLADYKLEFSNNRLSGSANGKLQIPQYIPLVGGKSVADAHADFDSRSFRGSASVTLTPRIPPICTPRFCLPGGCVGYWCNCGWKGCKWCQSCWSGPCFGPYCTPAIPAVVARVGFKYVMGEGFSWDEVADPMVEAWETSYRYAITDAATGNRMWFMSNWERRDKVSTGQYGREFSKDDNGNPITDFIVPEGEETAIFRLTFSNTNATTVSMWLLRPDESTWLNVNDGPLPYGFSNAPGSYAEVAHRPATSNTPAYGEAFFVLSKPKAGTNTVQIDNYTDLGHFAVEYLRENPAPKVTINNVQPSGGSFVVSYTSIIREGQPTNRIYLGNYGPDRQQMDGPRFLLAEFPATNGPGQFVIPGSSTNIVPGNYRVIIQIDDPQSLSSYTISSEEIVIENPAAPQPVGQIATIAGNGNFTVSWQPSVSSNVTAYVIRYTASPYPNTFENEKTVSSETLMTKVEGLTNGQPYLVTVVAVGGGQESKRGDIIRVIPTEGYGSTPPAITSVPRVEATAGYPYIYIPETFDGDDLRPAVPLPGTEEPIQITEPCDSHGLRWELIAAPSGMLMDPAGIVTWTPDVSQVGDHTVKIRATKITSDPPLSTEQTYTLTVLPTDNLGGLEHSPMTFLTRPPSAAFANEVYQYTPFVLTRSANFSIVIEDGPPGMAVVTDPTNGMDMVTWSVPSGATGHRVRLRAVPTNVTNVTEADYVFQDYYLSVIAPENQLPAEVKFIRIERTAEGVGMTWTGTAQNYQVQRQDMAGGTWENVGPLIPGGPVISFLDTNPPPVEAVFYQVIGDPAP